MADTQPETPTPEESAPDRRPEPDPDRWAHLQAWQEDGVAAYPDRFPVTHSLAEAKALVAGVPDVCVAGRIILKRAMGKLLFGHVQDFEGRLQFSLKVDTIGKERLKWFEKKVDLADHVGLRGTMWMTKKGELTLDVHDYVVLGKTLKPHPEKWHGVQDQEATWRKRYLDLASAGNQDTRDRFRTVLTAYRALRRYLDDHNYWEVHTPALVTVAGGAAATPFESHHNALDIPVFLRIAPETYLKRLLVGGFTKVYEFARCFRNEGISPEHVQDFEMIEAYAAYWNFRDNMAFTRDLIRHAVHEALGTGTFTFRGQEVDLDAEWEEVDYRSRVSEDSGIDVDSHETAASLLAAIREKGIDLQHEEPHVLGRGNLIDLLYKRVTRPNLRGPLFLTGHPRDVSPLARSNDADPRIVDRYQIIVGGMELINGYSELADPLDQWERFREQAGLEAGGDSDAVSAEDEFVDALMYGMPPASGWGLGLERFGMLITDSANIRDVIAFPLLRPSR